jgi:hypothetical protein
LWSPSADETRSRTNESMDDADITEALEDRESGWLEGLLLRALANALSSPETAAKLDDLDSQHLRAHARR